MLSGRMVRCENPETVLKMLKALPPPRVDKEPNKFEDSDESTWFLTVQRKNHALFLRFLSTGGLAHLDVKCWMKPAARQEFRVA